ncbi:MAG: beta-propeller domain-containing protein, partial [Phycisphaerales bacterium]
MYRYLPFFVTIALIPGCGVWCEWFGLCDRETGSPELKAFESEKELIDYFSQQISVRNDRFDEIDLMGGSDGAADDFTSGDTAVDGTNGAFDGPAPGEPGGAEGGDAGRSDEDFSQTTIQEEGVDEADVVKTDGTYLYIIDSEYPNSVLRIVRASPPDPLALLGEGVLLEGNGREIYLYGDKVVALTQTGGGFYILGGGGIAIDDVREPDVDAGSDTTTEDVEADLVEPGSVGEVGYERPGTIVTVIDVTSRDEPVVLSQTRFDGTPSSSRMIDGVLHLVLANYQDYYYDVLPMLGQPELEVSTIEVQAILPGFERVDADGAEETGNTVTWQELYRPTDPDGFGVVTVVSLDVDNAAEFTAVGIVAEPGLIYSSLNALYLTDTEWNFLGNNRETTDIYKFAYVDRGAIATATGSVPGRVLNQYSMGEYAGHLRVATTVGPTFTPFGGRGEPHNNVYILGQTGTTLQEVGSIVNIAPGETIQSARFIGERGYLVTFEQIDPLFTLDLRDPTDPQIAGELKVPGFSTFIVPMGEDHLLTVGQYIPEDGPFFGWGVQLSIFDVSDFSDPELATPSVVLGEQGGASSEALYNPKAFTYFAERGL